MRAHVQLDPRFAVLGLTDDLEPLSLENRPRRGTEAGVVIDDHHGRRHGHILAEASDFGSAVNRTVAGVMRTTILEPRAASDGRRLGLPRRDRLLGLDGEPQFHAL